MKRSSALRRTFSGVLVLACLVPSLIASPVRAQRAHASVTLTFWTPLLDPIGRSLLVPYFRQFEKKYPFITVKPVLVAQDNNWVKYTTSTRRPGWMARALCACSTM
jgi:ABC-type glycerol-3-phosphate transport system substrate-binding protein